ncbi:MAG: Sb-PDE family phosphodiesterase [Prolixibacteraceae bacterium]
MQKIRLLLTGFLLSALLVQAQTDNGVYRMEEARNPQKRDLIRIPNLNGFQTLKCDFHQHTVFSDGHVWPNVRIQEAWREGLDVIAITDHIEYQPHSDDVKVSHNRAFELAGESAAEANIILIKGSEITRQTPPGHFNAIFTGDASAYVTDREGDKKDKEAVLKPAEQDAFIFWNHPGWKADQISGSYKWLDFVEELTKEKILDGIEVFNGFAFHKKALDWCVDKGLTVMGSTDVHNLIAHDYNLGGGFHRSMTLVFAKERTAESVREALEEGRTVAWSNNLIAGKEEHVRNLFDACIKVSNSYYSKENKGKNGDGSSTYYYEIKNKSDIYFELDLRSGDATKKIKLYPGSSQILTARSGQKSVTYEVVTAFVRSDRHLIVDIPLN